ncbi:hypothetical protein ACFTZ8_30425, partial [Streptomyces fungicidicus]|uniref:hypothetical protein n=1 Tax=Streptomyces fungicidicus TaxID=68203 RepID=UPI00362E2CC4
FARSGWRVRALYPFQRGRSRQSEDVHPRPAPAPPTRPTHPRSRAGGTPHATPTPYALFV